MQINEKEKMNTQRKYDYTETIKMSKEKERVYNEMQLRLKNDRHQFQEEYAESLRRQVQHKNDTIISIPNKNLHSDINKMASAHSHLIPGLYNIASIGTRPIYRLGLMLSSSPRQSSVPKRDRSADDKLTLGRYNPITNQIPMITSNPYIMRELEKYKQSR